MFALTKYLPPLKTCPKLALSTLWYASALPGGAGRPVFAVALAITMMISRYAWLGFCIKNVRIMFTMLYDAPVVIKRCIR